MCCHQVFRKKIIIRKMVVSAVVADISRLMICAITFFKQLCCPENPRGALDRLMDIKLLSSEMSSDQG
jgi:hypothetical protein